MKFSSDPDKIWHVVEIVKYLKFIGVMYLRLIALLFDLIIDQERQLLLL